MSVAEKLEALEELLPLYSNQSQPALWKVRHALPQLLAVVEAAERADLAYFTVRDDTPAEAMARLATALAALDEALA